MPTDCYPNRLTFDDRMAEVAGILAAGILRRRKREMNQMNKGRTLANSGLDVFADKSVHSAKSLPKGESR
ncbi:MAG: hypothetical protein HYX78_04695 [Armatimonadetes bacterium]|nr:hypothetical protein [Armatimonadota bacterium]